MKEIENSDRNAMEMLTVEQQSRMNAIRTQVLDAYLFFDSTLQEYLTITPEQSAKARAISDQIVAEVSSRETPFGDAAAMLEYQKAVNAIYTAKEPEMLALLTAEQEAKRKAALAAPYAEAARYRLSPPYRQGR
jgi:hypothetical protein